MCAYFFKLENIARDNLRSFNIRTLAITDNRRPQSKSLLQFIDNGTSLVLLDKTDSGIEQE